MFYIRKNFKNIWYSFRLKKEEVTAVEDLTIKFGLKTIQKINKLAAEREMVLSETDKAALLVWSALKFESFASDFVEAQVEAEEKAKAEGSGPVQPPE